MVPQAGLRGLLAAARGKLGGNGEGSSFSHDLATVLAGRNFRRLFATRLISQAGDGMFTLGLGAYVFFNATSYPNPVSAATAFAVLYLPYSLVGPFAGVFIDRWSRRQILVWSSLIRTAFVALTAALVAAGEPGAPLYAAVLAALGLARFFLSSLSAALPHVVAEDKLVMANSLTTTTGTMVGFLGAFIGWGIQRAGNGPTGSAVALLAAGACYLISSAIAATMHRGILGPDRDEQDDGRAGILVELGNVAMSLAAGARHLLQRRRPTAVLLALACQRLLFGMLSLMSILLYRNYFYHSAANAALGHYILVAVASAIGYAAAAVITPLVTERLPTAWWIAILLACAGVVAGPLGVTFNQVAFLVIGFTIGLVAQGITISATTIIQQDIEDSYRGRVFAFYDMFSNVPYVLGAVVSAEFMPASGKSYALVIVAASGYVLAAVAYSLLIRQPTDGVPPPSSSVASPSAAAQRSSS